MPTDPGRERAASLALSTLGHALFAACVALAVALAVLNVLVWQGSVAADERAGQGPSVALTPQVGLDANTLPSQTTP